MYCTKCGLQAYPGDMFCSGCGASLSRNNRIAEQVCPTSETIGTKTIKQIESTPIRTMSRSESVTRETKIAPIGVKGWLLFLVIMLIFIGPLVNIGNVEKNFKDAETKYPNLISNDQWKSYKSSFWAGVFICIALSVYAGLGLFTGKNWKVVKRTIGILFIMGPLAIMIIGAIVPLIIFGSINELIPELIGSFFASLLWASIWSLYLMKSKRVQNTYGRTIFSEI